MLESALVGEPPALADMGCEAFQGRPIWLSRRNVGDICSREAGGVLSDVKLSRPSSIVLVGELLDNSVCRSFAKAFFLPFCSKDL